MKKITVTFLIFIIAASLLISQTESVQQINKNPEQNFLQNTPGNTPQLFAPGFISTEHFEHSSLTISKKYDQIYWSRFDLPLKQRKPHKIMFTRKTNGSWTEPQPVSFNGTTSNDGPAFSPAKNRIYFYYRNQRPYKDAPMPTHDIYYVDRIKEGWSEPVKLPAAINSPEVESCPSFSDEGHMVFARQINEPVLKSEFYFCQNEGNGFSDPRQILTDSTSMNHFNLTPCISPDDSMLLFASVDRPDGFGHCDLYVSFRKKDGSWGKAINMGETVNTGANERFPSLSPDGKYLFFISNRKTAGNAKNGEILNGYGNFFWVKTDFIHELKQK